MFESHRKFRTCVLCGRSDPTKEHIFGKAFAAYLNVVHNWTALPTPNLPIPVFGQTVKGSSPITNVAPKLLCAKCNNQRLSGMMNDSLPYLKDLSSGNPIAFQTEGIRSVKRYFERIALIMDVCTSNEQLTRKHQESREYQLAAGRRKEPAIITFVQRQAWLAGGPLVDTSIYMGHHVGILGLNPDVNIASSKVFRDGINGRALYPVKRISMVVKELAICVEIGTGQPDLPCSLTSIDNLTNWPMHQKVTYDDYFSLRGQDQPTQMLRLLVKNPQFVSALERLSREKGTFTLPDAL